MKEEKIIEGVVNKITDKFVFLLIEGLKSEPVLDINELKSLSMIDSLKLGKKISVLLEKIELKMERLWFQLPKQKNSGMG